MKKHDAAINLYQALECMRTAKSMVSNEAEALIDTAMAKVKATGDALYPEILEEMHKSKTDPLM